VVTHNKVGDASTPTAYWAGCARTQAGRESVSTGLVHQPSSEASVGTVNEALMASATQVTGGQILVPGQPLALKSSQPVTEHLELWPLLAQIAIAFWFIDIAIRRWEHLNSMKKWISEKLMIVF
jgi:hypothetical protein